MLHKKILVVGHPRGATGYMSVLLARFGVAVGHEVMKRDGISSWMHVDERLRKGVEFDHIIHVVREPWKTIGSAVVKLQPRTVDRRAELCGLGKNMNRVEFEARSYICWHKEIMTMKPAVRLAAEGCVRPVAEFLVEIGLLNEVPDLEKIRFPHKSFNKKRGVRFSQKRMLPYLSGALIEEVNEFYAELRKGCR